MSFLSSVLASIETGKPTSIPPPPQRSPAPAGSDAAHKRDGQKPASASVSTNATTRSANTTPAGMKRKAEEQLHRPDKPNGPTASSATSKASSAASAAAKPQPKSTNNDSTASQKPSPAAISSKPPPKGSFADLMLKAKEVQEKAPKVGLLRHQALPKEKLSKAEKKRRVMEAMAKEKEARLVKKSGSTSSPSAAAKAGGKPGEGSSIKRRETEEISYKGTARPMQPSYKGTAGLPSRRTADGRGRADPRRGKPSRLDEYLGTDEEDEGDYYDDYDDYYSDDLSDMEAGLEDVEREEEMALRAAKQEDEEDIRREMEAKKAKMERKKKLAALASKSK